MLFSGVLLAIMAAIFLSVTQSGTTKVSTSTGAGFGLPEESAVSLLLVAPDNTAINERDGREKVLTADNQGLGALDTVLTQKIRNAIVKEENFSLYAKNIKIISRNGVVTLRGPVRSTFERETIEQITAQQSPKGIVNLLEVAEYSKDPLSHIRLIEKRKNSGKTYADH